MPNRRRQSPKESPLEKLSQSATRWSGGSAAFAVAFGVVLLWLVTGPLFHFSDTWQLVINTGTTIVTFLMVFLIQRAQNKESRAMQLKLNELVAALQGASNRLVNAARNPASSKAMIASASCFSSVHTIEDRLPVSGKMAKGPEGRKCCTALP